MSHIPPPIFNNSNYHYPPYGGSTLRESRNGNDLSSVGGDPWGDYGLDGYGDSPLGGQNSALQQYSYDRQLALQTLQNGNLDPQSRQVWQNYLKELDGWFQQYGSAAQSMGGELGMGEGDGIPSSLPPLSFQDQTKVGWDDDVPEITATKTDYPGRDKKFFGYGDVNFTVKGSAKAHVTMEEDPAGSGIKVPIVTVTWPSDGTTQRYVFPNSAHIHVLAASPDKQVTIDTAMPAGLVDKNTISDSTNYQNSEASVDGVKQDDGSYYYETGSGQVIDFNPTGNGKKDDVQIHESYNDANITPLASDHIEVYNGLPTTVNGKPFTWKPKDGDVSGNTVIIRHRDGSFDVIYVHKSNKINLNAKKDYITWQGHKEGDIEGVPAENGFDQVFSLNKSKALGAGGSGGDNQNPLPDSYSDNGKTANYTKSASQDLTAFYGGQVQNVHISSGPGGTVTLHGASFADNVDIFYDGGGKYYVTFTSGEDPKKKITFTVDGPPEKITVDGVNVGHIKYHKNGTSVPYSTGVDPLITVTGEKPAPPAAPDWPGADVIGDIPSSGESTDAALELAQKINAAMQPNGDWQAVKDFLAKYNNDNNDEHGANRGNNIIRKLITAIYKAAGNDPSKFKTLMKLIPEDVRHQMSALVVRAKGTELGEKQEGDQWNSVGTAAQIDESFKADKPGEKPKDD